MCVRACVYVKVKTRYLFLISTHIMKVYEEVEVCLCPLLTYALDVGKWSVSGLGRFTPEFNIYTR